jgi:hypothetical protein
MVKATKTQRDAYFAGGLRLPMLHGEISRIILKE